MQRALTHERTNRSYDYVGTAPADTTDAAAAARHNRSRDRALYHGSATGGMNAQGSTDYLHPDQNVVRRGTHGSALAGDYGHHAQAHATAAADERASSNSQGGPRAPAPFAAEDREEHLAWCVQTARAENDMLRATRLRLLAAVAEKEARASGVGRWKLANGGVMGLLGFGMTTILLNLHNTGHYKLMSAVPAIGICYGGVAQLIAGVLEFWKGNTFGYAAFTSYGAFWLSLVCIWMLPTAKTQPGNPVQPTSAYMVGVFMLIWAIFSFMMMICTLRMNVTIFLLFLTLVLLFLLLTGGNMVGNKTAVKAAGYEGIVCGAIALYLAFAEVLNEVWDRTILPIGPFGTLFSFCGCGGGGKASDTASVTRDEDEEAKLMAHSPDNEGDSR